MSSYATGQYDSAASGFEEQLGDWFLKTDGSNDTLLISYDNPVAAASGELWDIDARTSGAYEQWSVTAYDSAGNSLGTIESPVGIHHSGEGSLNSQPWIWSFKLGYNAIIATIALQNIGTTNGPVGFNNFAANASGPSPFQFCPTNPSHGSSLRQESHSGAMGCGGRHPALHAELVAPPRAFAEWISPQEIQAKP